MRPLVSACLTGVAALSIVACSRPQPVGVEASLAIRDVGTSARRSSPIGADAIYIGSYDILAVDYRPGGTVGEQANASFAQRPNLDGRVAYGFDPVTGATLPGYADDTIADEPLDWSFWPLIEAGVPEFQSLVLRSSGNIPLAMPVMDVILGETTFNKPAFAPEDTWWAAYCRFDADFVVFSARGLGVELGDAFYGTGNGNNGSPATGENDPIGAGFESPTGESLSAEAYYLSVPFFAGIPSFIDPVTDEVQPVFEVVTVYARADWFPEPIVVMGTHTPRDPDGDSFVDNDIWWDREVGPYSGTYNPMNAASPAVQAPSGYMAETIPDTGVTREVALESLFDTAGRSFQVLVVVPYSPDQPGPVAWVPDDACTPGGEDAPDTGDRLADPNPPTLVTSGPEITLGLDLTRLIDDLSLLVSDDNGTWPEPSDLWNNGRAPILNQIPDGDGVFYGATIDLGTWPDACTDGAVSSDIGETGVDCGGPCRACIVPTPIQDCFGNDLVETSDHPVWELQGFVSNTGDTEDAALGDTASVFVSFDKADVNGPPNPDEFPPFPDTYTYGPTGLTGTVVVRTSKLCAQTDTFTLEVNDATEASLGSDRITVAGDAIGSLGNFAMMIAGPHDAFSTSSTWTSAHEPPNDIHGLEIPRSGNGGATFEADNLGLLLRVGR